jgi:hypothetical protein
MSLYTVWRAHNKETLGPPGPAGPKECERLPIPPNAIDPCHIRPPEQWDAVDRAVHAQANGRPLPPGWAVITGTDLVNAIHPERANGSCVPKPTRASLGRANPRLDADTCPGCFQPLGDTPRHWDAEAVCGACYTKATTSPCGFGLTLGRATRWNSGAPPVGGGRKLQTLEC